MTAELCMAWRDFILINSNREQSEERFQTVNRLVEQIQENQEMITVSLLKNEPDMEEVMSYREEIRRCRLELETLTNEFQTTYKNSAVPGSAPAKLLDLLHAEGLEGMLLDSLCTEGMESVFYQTLCDWRGYADYAENIWSRLDRELDLSNVPHLLHDKLIGYVMQLQFEGVFFDSSEKSGRLL